MAAVNHAPCALDASLWRECLKTFDYSPEKPQGACEKQRGSYYACMKDWRGKTGVAYSAKDFQTTDKCSKEAETFHTCMMSGMFEIANCKSAMLRLKACGYRNDESIRKALADDEEVLAYVAQQDLKQRRHWWDKIIGKA
ncbi:Hypothetical protein, putative [Bodo saltans]|uniref:Uncharacterized protein n=1 Tax=Bodo saltans TaxID=75058 RepID=A0A0S4JH31_BODSA|nr:Hypothetical protein, putative [Bodo saltans]|eukprot:CUG90831.1 Hypothetical protein, putative [Bodo saltans]